VKYDHPDLEDRFGENKGKDFVDDDPDPMPTDLENEYHGTHVAGIAAATTGNGTGVSGISNSRLLSCRALGTRGGSTSDIARAVRWATDQGADVINMSLGGGGFSDTMKNAVSYALNNGTLPICAAGNDCVSPVAYPARYNECVAVSAIDENGYRADFSNKGEDVDVCAPGVSVLSCWTQEVAEYGGKYQAISGTSMACPATAGVAALKLAQNGDLRPTQLREAMKQTAVDMGLPEEHQGAGRIDAPKLLGVSDGGFAQPPHAQIEADPNDPHVGETVYLSAPDDITPGDGYVTDWEWDLGDGTTETGQQVLHTYEESGSYEVELTATDENDFSNTTSRNLAVRTGRCERSPESQTFDGEIGFGERRASHDYEFETVEPCRIEMTADLPDRWIAAIVQGEEFVRLPCEGTVELEPHDIRQMDTDQAFQVVVVGSQFGSGDYEVTVTEWGYGGGEDPENRFPSAEFDYAARTSPPQDGDPVEFDASGSSDPDGSPVEYRWEFGDGSTAEGEVVEHTYDRNGAYEVELTVVDDDAAIDTATETVSIDPDLDNEAPTARIEMEPGPELATLGSSITFDGSGSTDPDGEVVSYEWEFDDGVERTGPVVEREFSTPGTHRATLTVRDDDDHASRVDGSDSTSVEFEVDATAVPTIETSRDRAGVGQSVEFDGSASKDPDGEIDRYEWAFYPEGDSTGAVEKSGPTVTHAFGETGTYTARLTVYSGGSSTATWQEISVVDPARSRKLVDSYRATLQGSRDNERISYQVQTADPAELRIALDGPEEADFDMYVTLDNSTPTPDNYDHRATSPVSDEEIVLRDGEAIAQFNGVAIGVYSPSALGATGEFTLTVEEVGSGDGDGQGILIGDRQAGLCGAVTRRETIDDQLARQGDQAEYTYVPKAAGPEGQRDDTPCQVTVSLSGPGDADFDLYVNNTGDVPSQYRYQHKSSTPDSQERIVVEEFYEGTALGILVHSWNGAGQFDLEIEEIDRYEA
jgi:serine protease